MFAVPLLECTQSDESAEVKRVYALVDRLSYLDWGLRSEDEVVGKRTTSNASTRTSNWAPPLVQRFPKRSRAMMEKDASPPTRTGCLSPAPPAVHASYHTSPGVTVTT